MLKEEKNETLTHTFWNCADPGFAGFKIRPKPFAAFPQQGSAPDTVPLPDGLLAPVDRFYRLIYGERVPVIESAVVSGRASLQPMPFLPPFPVRFRLPIPSARTTAITSS